MNLTREQIDLFLTKAKKRGERTLSLLGKHQDFIKAIHTDVGSALLSDLIREHEILLDKISNLDVTDEEKMQYKVTRKMLLLWSEKIAAYEDRIKEIKQA
jgi:thioredoxin-related protein